MCERCGTPLLLPDGRSAAEVVDGPMQTIEAIPTNKILPAAAQIEAPSSGTQHTTLTRDPLAGIAGGVSVAIVGAALWAGIAGLTHYRLGLVGLVIGLGVAFVFARFGLRGPAFAIVAAALAVSGCALGDIGAGTLIVSSRAGVSPGAVLTSIPVSKLMNVDALDALFYAVAGFAAFRRVARSAPAAQISRRTLGVRIAIAAVAFAVAITVAALGNQGKNNQNNGSSPSSRFQAGDCINWPVGGTVITSADCSGAHDALIDQVLTASETLCPTGDSEFVARAPNPNLCVNVNNHTP
jgi:hypothetical protein